MKNDKLLEETDISSLARFNFIKLLCFIMLYLKGFTH